MNFNEWLDTFLQEKLIDPDQMFTLKDSEGVEHMIPYGVVFEHMKIANKQEQKEIKDMIVKIDFKNGDVKHFFRHLAQAIVG